MSRPSSRLAVLALVAALTASGIGTVVGSSASSAVRAPLAVTGHDHHDVGTMEDPYAAIRAQVAGRRVAARTVSVSPSAGPDFEMPFRCGEQWVGSTRSTHSPSSYSIDFNRTGDTGRPVLSSARGKVIRSTTASGYGRYVIVDHGAGYSTLYAHLETTVVTVGQVLDQGGVVGYVGQSGRVTGPHLHFEQRLNGNFFRPYFHRTAFTYNRTVASLNCPDVPIAGDWDGDGATDLGVFRPGRGPASFLQRVTSATRVVTFGYPADVPVIGDWNGNRLDQVGRRGPKTRTFQLRGEDGKTFTADLGGTARHFPVSGKWVRGAKSGLGIFDHSTRRFTVRLPDLTKRTVTFGAAGTQPVVGDWDGDQVTDFGSFNPTTATWALRTVRSGTVVTTTIRYGAAWDLPVTGDWNRDGTTDLGVWRPSTATFYQRVVTYPNTARAQATTRAVTYGARRG